MGIQECEDHIYPGLDKAKMHLWVDQEYVKLWKSKESWREVWRYVRRSRSWSNQDLLGHMKGNVCGFLHFVPLRPLQSISSLNVSMFLNLAVTHTSIFCKPLEQTLWFQRWWLAICTHFSSESYTSVAYQPSLLQEIGPQVSFTLN